jgi:hypothetical protein
MLCWSFFIFFGDRIYLYAKKNFGFSGSHCLDLQSSQEDDPEWLIKQRKKEVRIIKGWIKQYYSDLAAFRRIHK